MTAPQDVCERVFDAMDELMEAVRVALVLDTEIDEDTCTGTAWLRHDGISISYSQSKVNELVFTLQVPMDTIVAVLGGKDLDKDVTP